MGCLRFKSSSPVDGDRSKFETYLRTDYWQLEAIQREDTRYILALVAERDEEVRRSAVEQTIKSLRNRADQFGVTEPTIARRGESNILIQLPGVKDPQRALDMIGRTAQLEFKIVEAEASSIFASIPATELPEGVVATQNTFSGPGGKSVVDNYLFFRQFTKRRCVNFSNLKSTMKK